MTLIYFIIVPSFFNSFHAFCWLQFKVLILFFYISIRLWGRSLASTWNECVCVRVCETIRDQANLLSRLLIFIKFMVHSNYLLMLHNIMILFELIIKWQNHLHVSSGLFSSPFGHGVIVDYFKCNMHQSTMWRGHGLTVWPWILDGTYTLSDCWIMNFC